MKSVLLTIIAIVLFASSSFAQEKPPADSKGTEFWFAFPPNYHNNWGSLGWKDDKLYIFIAADQQTLGELQYTDRLGGKFKIPFEITNVNDIKTIALDYKNFELYGWNQSGNILSDGNAYNDNEKVSPCSFRLIAEEEVSVYIQNQAQTTSDATLVYPIDAIGKNYFVMSYNAGLRSSMSQVTPSQFVIVATEDNTSVEITPPKGNPTQVNGEQPFTINLSQGQSYLVQSKQSQTISYDLTGTNIVATKPVTVIGGHQRAQVPLDVSVNNPSRDYLIQQLIPVESWHKSAFVVPFETVSFGVKNKDLVRVLSASDNNKISLNGQAYKTLGRAEFLELEVDEAIHLSSSAPMQVATYAKTTQNTSGQFNIGDPLMMLIHPKEQFYNEYKFINTQTQENKQNLYTNQYVAVILPSEGKASLKFDGSPVPDAGYLPIPDSDYEYKVLESSDGVHTITCDKDIAIYIYGYAKANSYGYIGGMNFRIFDHKDPVLNESKDCFTTNVVVTDTLPYDSGIEYFNIDNTTNLQLNQDKSKAPKVITFDGEVQNKYLDANVSYTVRDSMGYGYSRSIDIPGFTVSVETFNESLDIYEHPKKDSKLNETYCFDLKLQNYGNFTQEISDINFKSLGKVYGLENIPLPIIISPGQTKKYPICVASVIPITILDTINIEGDCLDRDIASVSYQYFADSEAPKAYTQTIDCNKYINITVTDTTQFDLGIDQVIYDTLNNMTISNESKSPYYTAQLIVTNLKIPAFYSVRFTDKYGNETTVTDTISPLSLRLSGTVDSSPEREEQYFGGFKIGALAADSIYLENYGEYPQIISSAYAVINRHFSVPKGQFPLTIPPFSEMGLEVVYHPDYVRAEKYRDTIIIEADCFSDYQPVAADAEPISFDAMSKCDVPLKVTSSGLPYELYISNPSPMPSSDFININYKTNFNDALSYKIYTNTGSLVGHGYLNIGEGNGTLSIPLNTLSNGQFLLKLNSEMVNESFVIIKQR